MSPASMHTAQRAQRNAPDVRPDAPPTRSTETPWFSGGVLPVQIGVYKRLSLSNTAKYSYFDGAHWLWNQASPDLAVRIGSDAPSLTQNAPWCGLVSPAPYGYAPMPTTWPTEATR